MRALAFCVGIGHAHFMAGQFNAAGLSSEELWTGTPPWTSGGLPSRSFRVESFERTLTVDVFNEGVDIPETDTIMLLRPTESATIFLQQLGRGLRWAGGKTVLTVLDFIGQAHSEYRFDIKFRALLGGTRRQVERAIEGGSPLMPPGCAIRLDEISHQTILANLRSEIRSRRRLLIDDLRGLPSSTTLSQFLAASSFDLTDIYARPPEGDTYTSALRSAGHLRGTPDPVELEYSKVLGRLLHVDDEERYERWRSWLAEPSPPAPAAPGSREDRLQWMLLAALGQRQRPVAETNQVFSSFWSCATLRRELVDLLDVLQERTRLDSRPMEPSGALPIHSHGTYGLYEIIAGYGLVSSGILRETREGVIWAEAAASDLLLITLNKSDEDYSPTTRYEDYPISPVLFRWEFRARPRRLRLPASATSTTLHAAPRSFCSFVRTAETSAGRTTLPLPRAGPPRQPSVGSPHASSGGTRTAHAS